MAQFAEIFPDEKIVVSLIRQLSWTHFIAIIPIKNPLKRDFYAEMCRLERWSVRTLRAKIDSMLFERTALSRRPEELIRLELLAQQARKAGIDKQTLARAQASLAFDAALTRAYLQQWLQQNPILLGAVQAEYDALKVRMGGQEVQIRHILVASLDEAVKVQAQIAAGGKFEELAASVSQDASSKKAGGLMPWVVQGALLPDIAQAVAKLNKGQMANAPVKGPAGYHLILLEDTRPFKAPELAEVQVQIKRNLESQAINVHIQKLREQASVK